MSNLSLVYAGPVEEVEVTDVTNGHTLTVQRGVPFTVPNQQTANGLLRNHDFQRATPDDEHAAGLPDFGTYDPAEHTVHDVQEYLACLPDDEFGAVERQRVLDLETAGKNRTSITS